MNKVLQISLLSILVYTLTSCSDKVVGTWNISKYETISPDKQAITLTNIGTITFSKKGTGSKEISYSVMGTLITDKQPFNYVLKDNLITLSGDSSQFIKTWIRVENKKNYQKFNATDGSNQVQILELSKK